MACPKLGQLAEMPVAFLLGPCLIKWVEEAGSEGMLKSFPSYDLNPKLLQSHYIPVTHRERLCQDKVSKA